MQVRKKEVAKIGHFSELLDNRGEREYNKGNEVAKGECLWRMMFVLRTNDVLRNEVALRANEHPLRRLHRHLSPRERLSKVQTHFVEHFGWWAPAACDKTIKFLVFHYADKIRLSRAIKHHASVAVAPTG